MEKFVFIKHSDICPELEKDIVEIKQQHWNYSYDSQIEWMQNNLQKDDAHLLFYVDRRLSAYLNLVNVEIVVENKTISAIGIGNVCVAKCKTGNGYGRKIVKRASVIIEGKNKIGILLCKENLERFYEKFGWHKVLCKDVSVADKDYDKTIMIVNSSIIEIKKLTIDRNF